MERHAFVSRLVGLLLGDRDASRFWLVGIDGVDGAGKTSLADELADELDRGDTPTVRVTLDGFHNPRARRYERGRDSPEGFFRDSYDYESFRAQVLEPLSRDGGGEYSPAIYDVQKELPVSPATVRARPGSVVIIDGIFLHRAELVSYWDYSVWLDVPFHISIPRGAARGFGDPDPLAASNRRYVEGQRLYIDECHPATKASVVVDNCELDNPSFAHP